MIGADIYNSTDVGVSQLTPRIAKNLLTNILPPFWKNKLVYNIFWREGIWLAQYKNIWASRLGLVYIWIRIWGYK
jgi:hypothetical protein